MVTRVSIVASILSDCSGEPQASRRCVCGGGP